MELNSFLATHLVVKGWAQVGATGGPAQTAFDNVLNGRATITEFNQVRGLRTIQMLANDADSVKDKIDEFWSQSEIVLLRDEWWRQHQNTKPFPQDLFPRVDDWNEDATISRYTAAVLTDWGEG